MTNHTLIVYVLQRLTTFYFSKPRNCQKAHLHKKKIMLELEIRVVKKIPGKQRLEKLEKE